MLRIAALYASDTKHRYIVNPTVPGTYTSYDMIPGTVPGFPQLRHKHCFEVFFNLIKKGVRVPDQSLALKSMPREYQSS